MVGEELTADACEESKKYGVGFWEYDVPFRIGYGLLRYDTDFAAAGTDFGNRRGIHKKI